jgi:hypothetical protein
MLFSELEVYNDSELKQLAKENNLNIEILGKDIAILWSASKDIPVVIKKDIPKEKVKGYIERAKEILKEIDEKLTGKFTVEKKLGKGKIIVTTEKERVVLSWKISDEFSYLEIELVEKICKKEERNAYVV